jgi:eukaryotic-like serine/threonine-protein kinase
MLKAPPGAGWEFDKFRLLPDKRLLLSDGAPVPLMAKAFDTLVLLLEKRDRVVSKDELLHAIWPGVVVEEGNLTQQIFLLRKALGESAQHPRYILTVPGHGYRFTAPVTEISPDAWRDADVTAAALKAPTAPRWWRQWRIVSGVILCVVLAALVAVSMSNRTTLPTRGKWSDPEAVQIQKITETGRITDAAMSADGRFVAYVESEGDNYSLYVQRVATDGKTQLIGRQSQQLASLRFSPDGEFVYFLRGARDRAFVLWRVPTIGGPETPILDDVDTPISFSPAGDQFVFMRTGSSGTHIIVADARGGTQRILAPSNGPTAFSPVAPAWSPDGKWVAASAADESKRRRSSIVLLPLAGGSSRELYTTGDRIGALRWLPDSSGLLTVLSDTPARSKFPPSQGGIYPLLGGSIWRIGYPGGEAERLTPDLADYSLCCVDIAADGRSIAGVLNTLVSDLWIAPAKRLGEPKQITRGNPVMGRHSWLPDNDTIVYADGRGRLNAVVHKTHRIFSLAVPDGHKVVGRVSACGDGRYVVFTAVPGDNIWRVPPTSGGATQLTSRSSDLSPACSLDGKSVVYASRGQNGPSLWRIPIDGGEPAPLMLGEAFEVSPSSRERLIFYAGFESGSPLRWMVNSSDGKRILTVDAPADRVAGTQPSWAPDESGLDYVAMRDGVSNIWRLPLTGGQPAQITHYSASQIFSFAWSPNAEWLSLASGTSRSDVVLISRK